MAKYYLSGTKLKVLLHVVVWAVLFILPTYLVYGGSQREMQFVYEIWFQFACYAVIFYLSYLVLAPAFFFKGRKVVFFLASALMIVVFTLLLAQLHSKFIPGQGTRHEHRIPPPMQKIIPAGNHPAPLVRDNPPPPLKTWPVVNFFLMSCMVTGLSLGVRLSEKLLLHEKLRKEAEKEKLNTELTLLKHQINPHFLFNTLNSIYSLALIKSDQTAGAVMKLSDMMRYVIQDVGHQKVSLSLELDYLMDYVELQKIRLSEHVVVHMNIEGDPKPYQVPPMILVPFIENAFKYGTSAHEDAAINIFVKISAGRLVFEVSNPVFKGREHTETFGIGIQNTRQRLNLMYPEAHSLLLTNDGKLFTVTLAMNLA
jgi:two-component system LytT family sensor kinase